MAKNHKTSFKTHTKSYQKQSPRLNFIVRFPAKVAFILLLLLPIVFTLVIFVIFLLLWWSLIVVVTIIAIGIHRWTKARPFLRIEITFAAECHCACKKHFRCRFAAFDENIASWSLLKTITILVETSLEV